MTPRSPVAAILWETARVTRAEVAWKLVLPVGGALAALGLVAAFGPRNDPQAFQDLTDLSAAGALTLLVIPHVVGWRSIARLNGCRPGFPLHLAYTRPVRTAVIVTLPMAYLTVVSTAIYLVSAMVLRVASGHAFPLVPVAAWLAALTMVMLAATWSTRNAVVRVYATMAAIVYAWAKSVERLTAVEIPRTFDWPPRLWPALFDWPRTDYAWIALIGMASVGIAIARVAVQRHGDELPAIVRPNLTWAPRSGLWSWLVNAFRIPCPTSSAMRAQLWFDLKSNGLPLLTIGVALAILILLLSAVSGPIDAAINADPDVSCPIAECFYLRGFPPIIAPFSLVIMLFLGGSAFGIRRKQGRTYVSAFEATQAYGTGGLAVLKLVVRSVCVLAALTALGLSAWLSLPLLGDAVFVQMWEVPLSSQSSALTAAVAELTRYEQLALAVVAAGGVALWVASWAALGALWTRYRRRLTIAVSLLGLAGLALAMVALARWRGIGPEIPLGAILRATSWAAAAAIVFATGYLAWRTVAERLLTAGQASGGVLVSMAFAAAWLTVLRMADLSLGDMPAAGAVWVLSPAWLPLTVGVLAPWSYSRIRHT